MVSFVERTRQNRGWITGIALVNVATFSWSTNMVLGRALRGEIGPLTLAASRFFIGSLLFGLLLQRRPPEDRQPGRDRWLLVAMAFSGVAFFSPTLYLGLRHTPAVNATLINGFGPLVTGIMATLLIHERMSGRQVAGAVVGLSGVVLLISGGSLDVRDVLRGSVGDVIVLGAVTLWSLYSVLGRRVTRHRSAISATAFSVFIGLPFLIFASILELQTFTVQLRPQLLLAILYIGVVPTVIGFSSWNAGVRILGSSGAMVFYNTLPLYGALLGVLFLDESVGLIHLLGGALIVGGGLWAARRQG